MRLKNIFIILFYTSACIPNSFGFEIFNINVLPTAAEIPHAKDIWSGWNWPISQGGVDSTVNDSLSPLKKIQIITDNLFQYTPISPETRARAIWWKGYCDSVTLAAGNYSCEPASVEYVLEDHKSVHFNREEIKGILAYFSNKSGLHPKSLYGDRKNFITPSEFHLAITNTVGILHESLGMVYGGDTTEIHNHLITGYQTTYGKNLNGQLDVNTDISYSPELPESTHDESTAGIKEHLKLHYTVNVDEKGNVLTTKNGHWLSGDLPKMLWSISRYRVETDERVPYQVQQLILQSLKHCSE